MPADQTLVAVKAERGPVIDGIGSDPVWARAVEIITHDNVADIDITLKAVHTKKEFFFLVNFPDPDESRDHKCWTWAKDKKLYVLGKDREDVFVFKWNMDSKPVDLSIYADNPYKADIWFWKADRTDPAGYADDKIQVLSPEYSKRTSKLTNATGRTMYLSRKGDSGVSAYKTNVPGKYEGDMVHRFISQVPTGGRADIKAKGVWKDGKWTIEFGRALSTGNNDDIQFDLKKGYQFGISRYEIAGRKPNKESTQPLYGSGDTGEIITLIFAGVKGD